MTNTLHIKNELSQLAELSDFLALHAGTGLLSELQLMQVRLALEETVTNVILYAYPGEKDKDIRIDLTCESGKLKMAVTDSGIPFNPLEKKDPDLTLPPEERPIGGLGVYLVKQLMTEVTYSRRGGQNIVTMIKNMH